MGNILIKNAEIITMNKQEEILHGDVRIKDDLIVEIGTGLIPQGDEKIIDATNRTLIPGFIQTHIHLCQTLFRGKGDDLELMDWLRKRIWPLEAAHDEESLYYSAMLGIGELITSGTTTIVDMETVHHTDFAFQAIAKSGIRALSGKVMMDQKGEMCLRRCRRIPHLLCRKVSIYWKNGMVMETAGFSMHFLHVL